MVDVDAAVEDRDDDVAPWRRGVPRFGRVDVRVCPPSHSSVRARDPMELTGVVECPLLGEVRVVGDNRWDGEPVGLGGQDPRVGLVPADGRER